MEERIPMNQTPVSKQVTRHAGLSLLVCLLAACASPNAPTTGKDASAAQPLQLLVPVTPEASTTTAKPQANAAGKRQQLMLEDALNPGEPVDLDAAQAHQDLWVRVRRGFAMPDLDDEWVRKAENWYSARPDYVQRMTERGSRYLFHVMEEVDKRGMPSELALLPFIESAFNPQAQSTAKASGMWQFVPATGRDFALKQNIFRDDRRDVLASTRAALDYLGRLYTMFGDWHLALAAYNWGQGNVSKAIARNQKAGLPTDYESLKMPEETRYYVPKLQAVKNIVLRPEAFALSLPAMTNHPYFLSVSIDRDMDVDVAARLAGMEVEHFKQFNPQMNKPVILAASTAQVLLPYDNAGTFAANLAAHRGQLATWTAWVVPKTMSPAEAAKQSGMNEVALRELNKVPPKMRIVKGSTLIVPRTAQRSADVSEHLADNASISLAPEPSPLRKHSFKAAHHDTVRTIAARYKVSAEQVAEWNKMSVKDSFKSGQRVLVYVAPAAGKRGSTTLASATKSGNSSKKRSSAASVKVAQVSSKPAAKKSSGGRPLAAAAAGATAALR